MGDRRGRDYLLQLIANTLLAQIGQEKSASSNSRLTAALPKNSKHRQHGAPQSPQVAKRWRVSVSSQTLRQAEFATRHLHRLPTACVRHDPRRQVGITS